MNKILIIVDLQNDFVMPEGKLNLGHDTKELRERIAIFAKEFKGQIIFTKDWHSEDSCEFKAFPPHCIAESWGAQVVAELKDIKGDVYHKQSFALADGRYFDPLDAEIHVVGVCTHICIMDMVALIVNSCKNRWNYLPMIVVHKNMVDDFDPEMAEFALKRMQNLYGVSVL